MAGATVTLDEFRKRAEAAGADAEDIIGGAAKAIEVISVAGCKEHFTRQMGPDDKPWDKLRYARPDGGNKVLDDKGLLKNSIRARTVKDRIELYASHPAANVHQHGATIVPKTARALAIPLTREAKRIGSPRKNRFPRPLFIVKTKAGKALLAENVNGELVWQYVLVRQVKIGRRMYAGWSPRTLDKIEAYLGLRLMAKLASAFDPKQAGEVK